MIISTWKSISLTTDTRKKYSDFPSISTQNNNVRNKTYLKKGFAISCTRQTVMITVFIFVFITAVQWYHKKIKKNYWILFSAHIIQLSKTKSEPLFIHTHRQMNGWIISVIIIVWIAKYFKRSSYLSFQDTGPR